MFGADSTSTIPVPDHNGKLSPHYFDHAQKLFEVGEDSPLALGIVTWGLGGFDGVSYRKLFAELGDRALKAGFTAVGQVAEDFISHFWQLYSDPKSSRAAIRQRVKDLSSIANPKVEHLRELELLRNGSTAGFCIGGHTPADRSSEAWQMVFSPEMTEPPKPTRLPVGAPSFWGVPNFVERVVFGIDPGAAEKILQSEKWSGSAADLRALLEPYVLRLASNLPIREAIDYVHAVISMTSKSLKFSHHAPVCGGPVEIAVITADRRFRWVMHKTMGDAVA